MRRYIAESKRHKRNNTTTDRTTMENSTTRFINQAEMTTFTEDMGTTTEEIGRGGWDDRGTYIREQKKKLPSKMYSWEELQEIEYRRRSILRRAELPFWQILCFWDGTCLATLSRDSLLWATALLYVVIRFQARHGDMPEFVSKLSSAKIDVIGGFLSFFLVIFVNQSNSRHADMYKQSMDCQQRLVETVTIATSSSSMPQASARRLMRYLNAAHVAGYVGLSYSRTYNQENVFDELNASLKLLTPAELSRVNALDMNQGADCFRELVTWCIADVDALEHNQTISPRIAGQLCDKILQFQAAMATIYGWNDQPVLFFYIHFLSLLTVCYLPTFAVTMAYSAGVGDQVHWTTDLLAGLIVLLQAIFVIGLRMIGQKQIDPYGADLEDLSVLYYIRGTWKRCNRILASQFPAPVDGAVEEDLHAGQLQPIGRAWQSSSESQRPLV